MQCIYAVQHLPKHNIQTLPNINIQTETLSSYTPSNALPGKIQ